MKTVTLSLIFSLATTTLFSVQSTAEDICSGFGPQTPRDIDNIAGTNKRIFSLAPSATEMNLCNIHFHVNAEHKAKDFSIFAGNNTGHYPTGHSRSHDAHAEAGGYQCLSSKSLSSAELALPKTNHCQGIKPGDTIEVHWVHSSCDIKPGKSLGACLSDTCANPNLRVETQVFTVVNNPSATSFADFIYAGNIKNGYHQAKSLPSVTGTPVEFLGSTTGPKYTQQKCSPMEVSWSVRPRCMKIDIHSLSNWCQSNVFEEDHAHGVRKLVVDPKLLSEIK